MNSKEIVSQIQSFGILPPGKNLNRLYELGSDGPLILARTALRLALETPPSPSESPVTALKAEARKLTAQLKERIFTRQEELDSQIRELRSALPSTDQQIQFDALLAQMITSFNRSRGQLLARQIRERGPIAILALNLSPDGLVQGGPFAGHQVARSTIQRYDNRLGEDVTFKEKKPLGVTRPTVTMGLDEIMSLAPSRAKKRPRLEVLVKNIFIVSDFLDRFFGLQASVNRQPLEKIPGADNKLSVYADVRGRQYLDEAGSVTGGDQYFRIGRYPVYLTDPSGIHRPLSLKAYTRVKKETQRLIAQGSSLDQALKIAMVKIGHSGRLEPVIKVGNSYLPLPTLTFGLISDWSTFTQVDVIKEAEFVAVNSAAQIILVNQPRQPDPERKAAIGSLNRGWSAANSNTFPLPASPAPDTRIANRQQKPPTLLHRLLNFITGRRTYDPNRHAAHRRAMAQWQREVFGTTQSN